MDVNKKLNQIQSEIQDLKKLLRRPPTIVDDWLDSSQVMTVLNISRATFDRLIRSLPHRKVNNRLYVHKTVIENMFDETINPTQARQSQ